MVILIALGFAVAIALAVLTVSSSMQQRSMMRRSIGALEGYELQGASVREQEMLGGFGSRVLAPVGAGFLKVIRKYTPVGYAENLARRTNLAGSPAGFEVDRLLVVKVIGLASGLLWIPLVYKGLAASGLQGLGLTGVLWAASFLGADLTLNRKIEARQHQIAVALPDILDLLVISVEAGLGFEQAIERTSASVPGPLSEEFRRLLQETRMGATRADALRAMDERTQVEELRSFILAMLQADAFGVSVSRILRSQADEMRIRRRLAAEEQAEKAPVKMLFPLVFCIFPAVFVVILGPAIIQINKTLH
ncbi:MAG: Type secretion system domain protein [Actinomycetia bacterium]|nr:Type secretion system domain protein [Actinomycetes bacterium]